MNMISKWGKYAIFYLGKNAYSCFAYFPKEIHIDTKHLCGSNGAMRFWVRSFGCALFYFIIFMKAEIQNAGGLKT